jgi:hypothetical protein
MLKNKTQKRNCENKFCKLFTKKSMNFFSGSASKNEKGNKVKQIFKIPFGGRGC